MLTASQALTDVTEQLKAAGFGSVSADPEQLAPDPVCVWLQPRQVRDYTLAGGATLVVWCYLIAGNYETPQAMALLDDALAGVLEVLGVAESDPVVDLAAAVALPTNPSAPLPAYRVAVDVDL